MAQFTELDPLQEYIFDVIPADVKGEKISANGRSLHEAYEVVRAIYPDATITWKGKKV